MMTEGRRPPHIALYSQTILYSIANYPMNEDTSPKNQMIMKLRANASPLKTKRQRQLSTIKSERRNTILSGNSLLVEASELQSSSPSLLSRRHHSATSIYPPPSPSSLRSQS